MGEPSLDCCQMKTGDEKEDRISQLSDVILHSILSYLPTKEAIRTSILSKQWQYIWTSISNINLVDSSYLSVNRRHANMFPNFVDRMFVLHDDSVIKRFRLQLCTWVSECSINSWVSATVKHNSIELDLSLPRGRYTLPCCLFTCKSLAVLKIELHRIQLCSAILNVPTYVHLRNLKCLCLSYLTLGTNCSNLFSSCPGLEQLDIKNCQWPKIEYLTIANSSLKSLTLIFVLGLNSKLKVSAPSLSSFHFYGRVTIEVFILDAPSLVDAYIKTRRYGRDSSHRAIKLLGGILNVKSLKVHDQTIMDIWSVENFHVHLPIFHKLTCLHIEVEGVRCSFTEKKLFGLPEKTPNLETLSISQVPIFFFDSGEEELIPKALPCCLHSKLKTISISCFSYVESEMHFLELVLKSAAILEMVKIKFSYLLSVNPERLEMARKEMQLLPRCSENCVITLL